MRYQKFTDVVLELTPEYAIEFSLELVTPKVGDNYSFDVTGPLSFLERDTDSFVSLSDLNPSLVVDLVTKAGEAIERYTSLYSHDLLLDLADDEYLQYLNSLQDKQVGIH
jgi:hypothetical protein